MDFKTIQKLSLQYPNNFELGEAIRKLVGSKEETYTIADNGEYLVGEEAIKYEENEFSNKQNKEDDKWIYESPDKGKTIYRRKFGDYNSKREKIK
tara:strand:- start:579 stop:863 length:285 start_codon:yes stop_codon:yes gene_type:complete